MKILIAILIFSLLVIFHEFGHFITAKSLGIKVNEFWVGMGPTIFSFTKGETKYCLKALWFGGACVMEDAESGSDDSRAFNRAPKWKRTLVIIAGPAFNFILAYVFALVVILMIGVNKPDVAGVMEGSPAEAVGISAGDTIVKINNYHIRFYNEISIYNFFHAGEDIKITYLHNGNKLSADISPMVDEESGKYLIGIYNTGEYTKLNLPQALAYAVYEVKYQFFTTIQSLSMLIGGRVSANELSGPVGIVSFVGDIYDESAQDGVFYVVVNMFSIIVLLSANLGLMNLLPLPGLDGGRLLIYLVEFVLRRELPEQVEGYINAAGMVLLLTFMLLVTASDITKFF